MESVMNEMIKNIESLTNFNFAKNMEAFKEFDAEKIGQQFLDFQKGIFDNAFNTMMTIQDRSNSMTASLINQNKFFPEEGRKMIEEWRLSFRKSQLEFKKYFWT